MSDLDFVQATEHSATLSTGSAVKAERLNQQFRPGLRMAFSEHVRPVQNLLIIKRQALAAQARKASVKSQSNNGVLVRDDHGASKSGVSGFDFGPKAEATTLQPERKENAEPFRRALDVAAISSPLDERLVFDTFVIGESNLLAHAAAQRVFAEGQSDLIYFYGESGVGKTHLLNGIAHKWKKLYPEKPFAYITHSGMRDGFSKAALTNNLYALHQDLLKRELILIDDIHLLIGKTRTQEEILNLVNAFATTGRQIVIAGEHKPSLLIEEGLNEKLADRLSGGLSAPISRAGEDLRIGVLRERRDRQGRAEITNDALEFIARHFNTSMREAIGMYNHLSLAYDQTNRKIGEAEARAVLQPQMRERSKGASVETLLTAAAEAFGLTDADLKGRAQPQRIVRARHAYVMVGRDYLNESFPQLSRALGRDHTTAMSGYQRAQALYEREQDFRDKIDQIRAQIGL
ncbi:MAG: DnaA/Hda family protein [Pseudomonadota bacterium]